MDEFFLSLIQGAAEGHLGEGFSKGGELGEAIWGVTFGAGELVESALDVFGDGDGGVGGGLIPFFGQTGAALVAEAAVVCGEGGADDHDFAHAFGREVTSGEGFFDAVGWFPAEFEGGGFVAKLEVFKHEVVGAATDEVEAGFFLAHFRSAGDPGIDEGFAAVIDPQAEAVFAANDEFVNAGVGGDDAAFKTEVEFKGIEGFWHGAFIAELQMDVGHSGVVLDRLFTGFRVGFEGGFFFGGDDFRAAIEGLKPAFFTPIFIGAAAEVADEIGYAGAVLAGGEAGEFDFGRAEPGLGCGGIKGVVDVGSDVLGVLTDAGVGVFFRHGADDFFGEGFQGALADEGFVKFAWDAFTLSAMAVGALGFVNGGTGMIRRRGWRSANRKESCKNEGVMEAGKHKGIKFVTGDTSRVFQ